MAEITSQSISTPQLITRSDELARAVELLQQEPFIGFDTETTGLDPHTTQLRLIQLATPAACFVIDCQRFSPGELRPALDLLAAPQPIKIAHNARFDAKFLLKNFGVRLGAIFDTLLASQLISAGDEDDRHGLEPVVARVLGQSLDKTEQVSDWSGELSEAQITYAARDASILIPLQKQLAHKLAEMQLTTVAQLEFDCVMCVAAMELAGVCLDVERWRALLVQIKIKHDIIAAELQSELGEAPPQMGLFAAAAPTINLDSPTQVKAALARLGIEAENTRETTLGRLARQHPVVAKLFEHRGLSRSLSSYGENILGFINPVTHRVHPDFRQIGTPTGRITSSSPSLQQIPNTPEYRSCFRAPEGRKLVVADYSQIEMRVIADFAEDPVLLAAFESGEDLHSATAATMFKTPLAEVTPQQRAKAKGLNYGLVYGMGSEGLAWRLEIPTAEAEKLIESYFTAYPSIGRWLNNAAATAVREKESRSIAGRLWRFKYDVTDRSQLGALRRVGKNAPIQGSASDIFKRAMTVLDAALVERYAGRALIVNSIHDEIVVECDEALATEIKPIVEAKMIEGAKQFLKRVPIVVDAVITESWVKK